MLKRDVRRLHDQRSFESNCIFGQRASTDAEHFVARFELSRGRGILADSFDHAGHIAAQPRVSALRNPKIKRLSHASRIMGIIKRVE